MNNVKKGVTIGYVNGDAPFSREVEPRSVAELTAEIERLQAEVDTLTKVVRKLNGDGVIYFRDEAVRGD
jgi:hypothetical protein